ncbi:LuxR family transcriptional regulator [Frateuria defendens]|uniref:LuxR family transcriptional regulator n=1 Tax=Frateuria defendens TaxID=2219559 RepID=UPI00066FC5DF|nr:LuxR family transcriptional regulator [Frateuria defendens]
MLDSLADLCFQDDGELATSVSDCLDCSYGLAAQLGFDAVTYDFAPVSTTPEGRLITPSVVEFRNVPQDMRELWVGHGLYQRDPVQRLALRGSRPFFWSYRQGERSALQGVLDDWSAPVATFLRDCGISQGVTVPLHMPGNRFATMTGLWRDDTFRRLGASVGGCVVQFTYLAHVMNDRVVRLFSARELAPAGVSLSPRELECLSLAAEGLSTKRIAWKLNRSESTVILHLQSAARKLGGRNRAQAIARAAHFGLLAR